MQGGDEITIRSALDSSGVSKGIKDIESRVGKFGKNVTKGISGLQRGILGSAKKITNTLKGLGLRVLALVGAVSVASKAVSAYMSVHYMTAAKLEACWQALGEVLAPIIEQIVELVATAVSWFIDFLHILGISQKSAKQASQDARKAAQEINKSLMGFDELNRLNRDTTTTIGDTELPSWISDIASLIKDWDLQGAAHLLAQKINEWMDSVDWAGLGKKFSDRFLEILRAVNVLLEEIDWDKLGTKVREFLLAIDWEGIFKEVVNLIFDAIDAAVRFLWGLLTGEDVDDIEDIPLIKSLHRVRDIIRDDIIPTLLDLIEKLQPFLVWIMEKALPWIVDRIGDLVEDVSNFLKFLNGDISFGDWITNLSTIGTCLMKIGVLIGELKLVDFITKIGEAGKAVGQFFGLFGGGTATAIAETATATAEAAAAAEGATTATTGATTAITGLGMACAPVIGLVGGIVAGTVLGVKSIKEWDAEIANNTKTVADCKTYYEELQKRLDELRQQEKDLAESGGDLTDVQNEITMVTRALNETTEEYTKRCEEAGVEAIDLASTFENEVTSSMEDTEALIEQTGNDISEFFSGWKEGIITDWGNLKQGVTDVWQGMSDGIAEKKQNIETTVDELKTNVEKFFSDWKKNIEDDWSGFWKGVEDTGKQITDKVKEIKEGILKPIEEFKTKWEEKWNAIGDWVRGLFGDMKGESRGWGYDMVDTLADGISSATNSYWLNNALNSLTSKIRAWLHFSEPDTGPLSDFHTYMPDMIKGMAEGIEDNEGLAIKAVNHLAQGISDEISGGEYVLGGMDAFGEAIVGSIESLMDRLQSIANGVTFSVPDVALGTVTPYSTGSSNALGSALSELTGMGDGEVKVAVYLDGRQMTDVVTKTQRKDRRAKGR